MIRFDAVLQKYVISIDGMIVGTFDTFAAALKHMRNINN
jgi:hypothetical protein